MLVYAINSDFHLICIFKKNKLLFCNKINTRLVRKSEAAKTVEVRKSEDEWILEEARKRV